MHRRGPRRLLAGRLARLRGWPRGRLGHDGRSLRPRALAAQAAELLAPRNQRFRLPAARATQGQKGLGLEKEVACHGVAPRTAPHLEFEMEGRRELQMQAEGSDAAPDLELLLDLRLAPQRFLRRDARLLVVERLAIGGRILAPPRDLPQLRVVVRGRPLALLAQQ